MELTDYTSYAEIRAVIGLSSSELSDDLLKLELYSNVLEMALDAVVLPTETPGPGPLKSTFIDIAETVPAARTDKEQLLYSLTRLYSTYVVAAEVAISLPMAAPKMISDSKASLTRFSPEATFRDVVNGILARASELKGKIENINISTASSLPLLSAIPPAVDRVTFA
jgi:hypothetical protein